MSLLSKYGTDRQIIYTTHSPYFIDFDAIINNARVARVFKKNDTIIISQLDNEKSTGIKGLISDLHNPHTLGLNAKEAFFLDDGVILVEGQEDVILYEKISQELGVKLKGEFFGWGVGGAEKMRFVATILAGLGFEKVAGILDGDKKELAEKLKSEFGSFHFINIPTDDVRTKKQISSRPAKNGLVDENLKLKKEYRANISEIYKEINTYFKT